MKVWLPFRQEFEQLGVLPSNLDIEFYEGGDEPDSLSEVQFYVPKYMGDNRVVEIIDRMPKVEVVQTLTAGYDNVLPHLRPGITLCNARGVHDASTAELAVGLAIAAQRGLGDFARAQTHGEWLSGRRLSLADRRVLLVGYGAIGEAIERRLAPFECEITRVARTVRDGVSAISELPELLPHAEIVILIVPLTEQTTHLVDTDFLAAMPDDALLVNVARGPVVDTDALLAELQTGRLRAALDVTDPEPLPPDHPLWTAPGVLISPHVGGNSTAFLPRALRLVSEQLWRYAEGKPLENVVYN